MNVLITGANRGIGLELTKQMLIQGHRVFATVREPSADGPIKSLQDKSEGRLSLHQVDAASQEDWCRLAGELATVELDLSLIHI